MIGGWVINLRDPIITSFSLSPSTLGEELAPDTPLLDIDTEGRGPVPVNVAILLNTFLKLDEDGEETVGVGDD